MKNEKKAKNEKETEVVLSLYNTDIKMRTTSNSMGYIIGIHINSELIVCMRMLFLLLLLHLNLNLNLFLLCMCSVSYTPCEALFQFWTHAYLYFTKIFILELCIMTPCHLVESSRKGFIIRLIHSSSYKSILDIKCNVDYVLSLSFFALVFLHASHSFSMLSTRGAHPGFHEKANHNWVKNVLIFSRFWKIFFKFCKNSFIFNFIIDFPC